MEACPNLLPEHLAAGRPEPRGLVEPCADAALHGRHGRTQPHRGPAGGPFSDRDSPVRQFGICRAGRECLERQGCRVRLGWERQRQRWFREPGCVDPTKQARSALRIRTLALRAPAVPGSATVWGLRAETGSGRVRFVHHLGLRFLEHVRTGQSATAVAPTASRARSSQTRSPESPCLKCLGLICLTATANETSCGRLQGFGAAVPLPGTFRYRCG